jgi:hypothetical protein
MDNEKTHVKFVFSYPCWWVGETSEVVKLENEVSMN